MGWCNFQDDRRGHHLGFAQDSYSVMSGRGFLLVSGSLTMPNPILSEKRCWQYKLTVSSLLCIDYLNLILPEVWPLRWPCCFDCELWIHMLNCSFWQESDRPQLEQWHSLLRYQSQLSINRRRGHVFHGWPCLTSNIKSTFHGINLKDVKMIYQAPIQIKNLIWRIATNVVSFLIWSVKFKSIQQVGRHKTYFHEVIAAGLKKIATTTIAQHYDDWKWFRQADLMIARQPNT